VYDAGVAVRGAQWWGKLKRSGSRTR
jgi:hypothetical protein